MSGGSPVAVFRQFKAPLRPPGRSQPRFDKRSLSLRQQLLLVALANRLLQPYVLSSETSVHTIVPSGHSLPISSPYQPSLLTSILAGLRVPLLKIVAAITQNRKLSLGIIRRGDDPPGTTDVASAISRANFLHCAHRAAAPIDPGCCLRRSLSHSPATSKSCALSRPRLRDRILDLTGRISKCGNAITLL